MWWCDHQEIQLFPCQLVVSKPRPQDNCYLTKNVPIQQISKNAISSCPYLHVIIDYTSINVKLINRLPRCIPMYKNFFTGLKNFLKMTANGYCIVQSTKVAFSEIETINYHETLPRWQHLTSGHHVSHFNKCHVATQQATSSGRTAAAETTSCFHPNAKEWCCGQVACGSKFS